LWRDHDGSFLLQKKLCKEIFIQVLIEFFCSAKILKKQGFLRFFETKIKFCSFIIYSIFR